MAASALSFGFKVLGRTRDEALEKLDTLVREALTVAGGEPWITITDDVKKIPVDRGQSEANMADPDNWGYLAVAELVFAGPNILGEGVQFRDGFRPQDGGDFGLGPGL
jgi:hypothetical protein